MFIAGTLKADDVLFPSAIVPSNNSYNQADLQISPLVYQTHRLYPAKNLARKRRIRSLCYCPKSRQNEPTNSLLDHQQEPIDPKDIFFIEDCIGISPPSEESIQWCVICLFRKTSSSETLLRSICEIRTKTGFF